MSQRAGGAGIAAELRRQGGATAVEPISADVEPAGKRVAAALELPRSDRVVVITRLRLASGRPLAVERSSSPCVSFRTSRTWTRQPAARPDGRVRRPRYGRSNAWSWSRRGRPTCGHSEFVARRPSSSSNGSDTQRTAPRSSSRATASGQTGRASCSSRPRSQSEVECARCRHRRRCRRLLDPVLADAARLGRRRARRARQADQRLHVSLGRARRPAARLAGIDRDDDVVGRAVPDARRPRSGSRPAGTRWARSGSPVRRSGSRRSPARQAGRRRSGCRSSWFRPLRRRRCSRRCRSTVSSARRTSRATATSTRASSRLPSPRGRGAAGPRSTRRHG